MKDGLVHVFDANPAAPTYLYVRGNEKDPDKSKPIPPAVPAALRGPAFEIKPVPLPAGRVRPGQPGLRHPRDAGCERGRRRRRPQRRRNRPCPPRDGPARLESVVGRRPVCRSCQQRDEQRRTDRCRPPDRRTEARCAVGAAHRRRGSTRRRSRMSGSRRRRRPARFSGNWRSRRRRRPRPRRNSSAGSRHPRASRHRPRKRSRRRGGPRQGGSSPEDAAVADVHAASCQDVSRLLAPADDWRWRTGSPTRRTR